jgi:uncharacterized phage protein (TIGR01671 family)
MRELKFRAWDVRKKRMLPWKQLHLSPVMNDPNSTVVYHRHRETWQANGDLVPLQFTGLRDKSGKEIYEGDVLRSRENDEVWRVDDITPAHRHSHVTNIGYFYNKKFHSRMASAAYDNHDDWMSWPEMYTVIGNVYENLEFTPN